MNMKQCLQCKTNFIPARSDAKFCSPSCRQTAYAERLNSNENLHDDGKGNAELNVNETDVNKHLTSIFDAYNTLLPSIMKIQGDELPSSNRQENKKMLPKPGDKAIKIPWRRQHYLSKIHRKIDKVSERIAVYNVNFELKGWIEKLFEYEYKREIFRHNIEKLLQRIFFYYSNVRSILPLTYPHADFIENELIPKLERMLEALVEERLLTFKLVIPKDFREDLMDIMTELTD
jgi:hypothetical protein